VVSIIVEADGVVSTTHNGVIFGELSGEPMGDVLGVGAKDKPMRKSWLS
jgi:hypothetical protein